MLDITTAYLIIPTTGLTSEEVNEITAIAGHTRHPETAEPRPPQLPVPAEDIFGLSPAAPSHQPLPTTPPADNPAPPTPTDDWPLPDVDLVLARLARSTNGWLRGLAIRTALDGQGTITREQIHQLGHPHGKGLKGFARPVGTTVSALINDGLLAPGYRPQLLTPDYDGGAPGTAVSYHVPRRLLAAWKKRSAEQSNEAA